MQITRSLKQHGSLLPETMSLLRAMPDSLLVNDPMQIQSPRTAYSRSLDNICEAWLEVLPAITKLSGEFRLELTPLAHKSVEKLYGRLLHSLNEHIDVCYLAMRSIKSGGHKFHDRAVREQRVPGSDAFVEQVHKGYRDARLGLAVNRLKHHAARICVVGSSASDGVRVGYFIDGPIAKGILGPWPELHDRGKTAFSFARDMLLHFWWLYRASQLTAAALVAAAKLWHNLDLAASATSVSESGAWSELCWAMHEVSPQFFPDEESLPYPLVIVPADRSRIDLRFPAGRRPHRAPDVQQFSLVMTISEGTSSYAVPYWANPAEDVTVDVT